MFSLLIRNANIARADGSTALCDVACGDGLIQRIDSSIDADAADSIDANGMLLLPGAIDPQVHFRDPGALHKEDLGSGSRAAVKGGGTSFLEMPNTNPPTVSQDALDAKLYRAAKVCVANYGFFIGATPDNLDAINTARPACGIKIFMGSSTGSLLVDKADDLERIFANGDRLIAVHAEDEARIIARSAQYADTAMQVKMHSKIRDRKCALLATERALELSERYKRPLHILHLSTADEVALLRQRKPDWVSAEAIPNHLLLNESDYAQLGSRVQMNPPIRTANDNASLWQGLHDGILDCIATDHAPHTLQEKEAPYPKSPAGMPGVETSLPLLLTEMASGRCSLAEVQRWMCSGPARIYRISNKGVVETGWDADLTLVDMDNYRTVHDRDMFTRAGWTPFAGRRLTGWPQHTVVGGHVVYSDGQIIPGVTGRALTFE